MNDKELIKYLNDFIAKIKSKPLTDYYVIEKGRKKRKYPDMDDIVIAIEGNFNSAMHPPKKNKGNT